MGSWDSWDSWLSTYEDHALHSVLHALHHILKRLHPLDDDGEFGMFLRTKVSHVTCVDVDCASMRHTPYATRTRMKLMSSHVRFRS
jgi:hypothetical protein